MYKGSNFTTSSPTLVPVFLILAILVGMNGILLWFDFHFLND